MPSSYVDWKGNSPKTASTLITALSHTRKHFSNELFIYEASSSWWKIRKLEVITKRAPRAEARWLCHQSLSQHGDRVDGLWFLVRNTTHGGFPCLLGRLWLDNEMHTLGTRARSVVGENWFHRFGFGNRGDGLKLRLKSKRRPLDGDSASLNIHAASVLIKTIITLDNEFFIRWKHNSRAEI